MKLYLNFEIFEFYFKIEMDVPDLQPPPDPPKKSDYGRFYLIIQQIYNHPGRDDLKDIFKLAADQNGGLISLGDFEQICNTLRDVIGLPPFVFIISSILYRILMHFLMN